MKRSLFSILFVTAALAPAPATGQLDQIWTYFFDYYEDMFYREDDDYALVRSPFTIEALVYPWRKGIDRKVDEDDWRIDYSDADDKVESLGWFNIGRTGYEGISIGFKKNIRNQWAPWFKGKFIQSGERMNVWFEEGFQMSVWNRWIHQAVTYTTDDGGTIEIFINGSRMHRLINIGTIERMSHDRIYVGKERHEDDNRAFNGFIREARVWSSALKPDTIRHYMQTIPDENHPNSDDLIFRAPLYWVSDDGTTNRDHGRVETVSNSTMSAESDVHDQYGPIEVFADNMAGFRRFLDPWNVRATGGRNRMVDSAADDSPQEYRTTVRWDWNNSWGNP